MRRSIEVFAIALATFFTSSNLAGLTGADNNEDAGDDLSLFI